MKKKLIITLKFLLILIISIVVVFKLWEAGIFIFNRSADVSSNHVSWNGKEYSTTSGEYTEGRTIAKGKSGDWKINMVKEDPSRTFIVARSFFDQYLLVSDDYAIPTNGKITTISWNGTYITDEAFLNALATIEAEKVTTFTYENCPVTTEFKGYMGKVNDEWVITTYISSNARNDDGSPKPYSVSCYKIPSEYWNLLSKYFS